MSLLHVVSSYLPMLITGLVFGVIWWSARWLLLKRQPELGNERKFYRQLIMLGLTISGILALALALPVQES